MSETALSKATMLASLRDIRLPAEAAGGVLAEYAAALGLAALASVFCVVVLRSLSIQRQTDAEVKASGQPGWSGDRRRIALLHWLKDHNPDRYAELRGDLYRPGGGPDLTVLEDEVARGD